MSPSSSAFFDLIAGAARMAPDWPVFNANYAEVLRHVHAGGRFNFHGLTLDAPPGVYPPSLGGSSAFIATHAEAAGLLPAAGKLLEVGTGTGALALLAARAGWQAAACDLDPVAVEAARSNARANGVALPVLQSDLFAAFAGQRFDVVLFNLPHYHKAQVGWAEHTLSDANGNLARRFLDEAAQHLTPGGFALFTYSNCSDPALLERTDWRFELVGCDYDAVGRYWRALVRAWPRA